MNRYYAVLFEPVKRHGGLVQDVVGDSMLAIWATTEPDLSLRSRACLAALDIAAAVDRFNAASGRPLAPDAHRPPLGPAAPRKRGRDGPLRVPGGRRHREHGHAPGGPQQAPRDPAAGQRGSAPWPGRPDKSRAWVVPPGGQVAADRRSRAGRTGRRCYRVRTGSVCAIFAGALDAYRRGAWPEAMRLWEEALRAHGGEDGPSRFYLRWCETHAAGPPPADWDGVVRMDQK